MSDVTDRLDALEAQLASGIQVRDLPLKALQDKLEQDWQPSGTTLLGPSSVTDAMLGRASGFYSTTWPGGVAGVNVLIPHGLGAIPTKVLATSQSELYVIRWMIVGTTDTLLQLNVQAHDNAVRAAGTVLALSWEVIR